MKFETVLEVLFSVEVLLIHSSKICETKNFFVCSLFGKLFIVMFN